MIVIRGECQQELVRYFYSPKQESCFTFTWSGCGVGLVIITIIINIIIIIINIMIITIMIIMMIRGMTTDSQVRTSVTRPASRKRRTGVSSYQVRLHSLNIIIITRPAGLRPAGLDGNPIMGSSFEYSYTRLASRLRRSAQWNCLETGDMIKPLEPSNLPTFQPSNLPTFHPSKLPTF